jgi:predicted DNA-binding transcriptional regulator AlpA
VFHERALWSVADIARYTSMSPSRIRDSIVCQPDFPRAIRATPTSHPRWRAGDVWAWFEARQEA